MKKIFNFILLTLCVISYSSCSNDEGIEYFNESSVKIVSRDITFPAAASQGSIVVEAPSAFTVTTSDQGWCTTTISGSTITVNVEQNPRLEGRSSMLTIHCGTDSTAVAIVQSGVVFKLSAGSQINVSDEAATYSYDIESNTDITITPTVEWISTVIKDGKLHISLNENSTGNLRTGSINYSAGEYHGEIKVTQYEFEKDLAGEYNFVYTNTSNGNLEYFDVELKKTGDTYSIDIPDLAFSIPITYSATKNVLTLHAGEYIGDFSTYKMFITLWDTDGGDLTWTSSVSMSAPFQYMEEEGTGYTVAFFKDNGSWPGYTLTAIRLEAFSSMELSTSTRVGSLRGMFSPYLLRSHAPKETVATMKAKSIKKTDLTLSYMK